MTLSRPNTIVLQYTEFTAYTAILQGATPPILQGSMIARHRQTWKLREHHLISADPLDSGVAVDLNPPDALSAGDPLRSHFPTGTQIKEHKDGIELHDPSRQDVLLYQRATSNRSHCVGADHGTTCTRVQDIVITGEVLSLHGFSW